MSNSTRSRRSVLHNHQDTVLTGSLRVVATVAAVFLLAIAIATFARQGGAQNNPNREGAFAHKADKILKRVRRATDEDRELQAAGKLRLGNSEIEKMRRSVAVDRRNDGRVLVDVAVTLAQPSADELKSSGFAVASVVGNIATVSVDIDRLGELASLSSVVKMSAAVLRYPMNDRAKATAGVDDSSGQRVVAQTGRNIVVGVIDSGIDFRHLDFTVPGSGGKQTRIKALLDMTVYGQTPDPGWNYVLPGQSAPIGHLYTEADINAALQIAKPADQNSDLIRQRDKNGHGTHVAGTAAGNGLSSPSVGTYAGMAPEADLIIVKATRANTDAGSFRTTDTINALSFIQQKASELGEPFVINMSLGGHLGPHDGTGPDERAIDNLVNGSSGRAVVVAAGNEGSSSIHARSTVPTAGSLTLDFNVNGSAQFVDLYHSNADRFSVTVTRPDGTTLGPVSYDPNGFASSSGQASDQYLQIYNTNDSKGDADPANDQPDIFLIFKADAPDGMWKITLQDADSNANQSFDAWAGGDGVYFSTYMDSDSHLVGSPGTARGAITVGAFVTRSSTQTIGGPASFTSPGPTADGRQKPEISAAGYYLYSPRSTDVTGEFGTIGTGSNAPVDGSHYTGLAGTSMATPVVTGAVALLLESNPTFTADQIKSRLTTYTVKDMFTGTDAWNKRLGFGKLNIANAISQSGGGISKYTISGRVTDPTGNGVPDLQMFLDLQGSSHAMTRTDGAGNYSFTNILGGGNYVVYSHAFGLVSFSPASYTFNNLSANQTANFVRTVATTVTIRGRITDPIGATVPNVRVELPGARTPEGFSYAPVPTDSNGNYVLTVTAGKDYMVAPSSQTHIFTPASRTYLNVTENQIGADFLGQASQEPQVKFESATYFPGEGNSFARVRIVRTGNTSSAAKVDYGTDDLMASRCDAVNGQASAKCDYATAGGTVRFAPGETIQVIEVPLVDDSFVEGVETFTISLSNPNGFIMGFPATALMSIQDNDSSANAANPFLDTSFFVRQHYLDFLLRDPDAGGHNSWANLLVGCGPGRGWLGSPPDCDRVHVSSGFFRSTEFGEKGYWIYRFYESALGRRPQFAEFTIQMRRLSGLMTAEEQEIRRADFINSFMQLPEFTNNFSGLTDSPSDAAAFVTELEKRARVTLPASAITEPGQPLQYGRQELINRMASGQFTAGQTLRAFIEQKVVWDNYFYRAFVAMQYFGYLRRDPDDNGYNDWVRVLTFGDAATGIQPGDYRHLIFGFVYSVEYRERFGKP